MRLSLFGVILYAEILQVVSDARLQQCRDRDNLILPIPEFMISSCSMCYFYLIKTNPKFVTKTGCRPDSLKTVCLVETSRHSNRCYCPSLNDDVSMEYVSSTISDSVSATRWKMCCEDAQECCQQQLSFNHESTKNLKGCPSVWDGWSCWNRTSVGTTVSKNCPRFLETYNKPGNTTKFCTEDGHWWKDPDTHKEKTSYTACFPDDLAEQLEFYRKTTVVSIVLNTISTILLFPSIVIFFCYRNLRRQKRIRIHAMLFTALLCNDVSVLCWNVIIKYPKVTGTSHNESQSEAKVLCDILIIMEHYFRSTTYFWMACEGFYLHRLLINAFSPPKRLFGYYLVGWGLPFSLTAFYVGLRLHIDTSVCWVEPVAGEFSGLEWVLFAPTILCIIANVCFLLNIMRILLRQLVQHPQEPKSYRKAVKATCVLIPLFGIHQFFTLYRPQPNDNAYFFCEMAATIIYNFQGIAISLIFCFFNTEVISNLKMSWKRCIASPNTRRRSVASVPISRQTSVLRLDNIGAENPSSFGVINPNYQPTDMEGGKEAICDSQATTRL